MKFLKAGLAFFLFVNSACFSQENTSIPNEAELVLMENTNVKYGTKYGQQFYKKGDTEPYTGFLCARYENGELEAVQQYINGIANGIWINYDPYGCKESQGMSVNNKTEGPVTFFYEDGSIKSKGQYIHYKNPIGWWTYFDRAGNVVSKRHFTR